MQYRCRHDPGGSASVRSFRGRQKHAYALVDALWLVPSNPADMRDGTG